MFEKLKRLFTKSPKPIAIDADYEFCQQEERLFFRNNDFTIEITSLNITTPPENWTEAKFAITKFQYDILLGEDYIKALPKEQFEILVGGWINNELGADHEKG